MLRSKNFLFFGEHNKSLPAGDEVGKIQKESLTEFLLFTIEHCKLLNLAMT